MKHVTHVGPLAFGEMFAKEKEVHGREENKQRLQEAGQSRVRNILRLPSGEQLSTSHNQLARQMERVLRGESLSKKKGAGFFSLPTEDRGKDVEQDEQRKRR